MTEKKNLPTSQKTITDSVLAKINQFKQGGELLIPKDYSPENALKSAYLILTETKDKDKKPVLETCSRESVANTLLRMVVEGLSPLKGQCYFIPYAGKLQYQRSYQGSIALAKRYAGVKNVVGAAIFEGDKFKHEVNAETGIKKIILHEQSLENLSNKVKGAYAIVTLNDDSVYVEIMNIKQITSAWNQRQGNGLTGAHENFSDQMAIKTVINRACKHFTSATDDSVLFSGQDKPNELRPENEEIEDISFEETEEIKEETKQPEKKEQLEMKVEAEKKMDSPKEPGF